MSWDVSVEMDTGGPEPMRVDPDGYSNYTSNVAAMFAEADFYIRDLHGMACADAAAVLRDAIARLESDPDRFRALNPENGWGRYETAIEFLRGFERLCGAHPKAKAVVR